MSTFTPEEVAALQARGNQYAKKMYLSRWNTQQGSQPDGSDVQKLRDFIKQTYIQKRYADNPENCFEFPRIQKIDNDGHLNHSSSSFEEVSTGCVEDPLRNSIKWRNGISCKAVNDKILHYKQHVKSRSDGLPTKKEAEIEQKVSKYLEELNLISDQLRETIQQPFESNASPNVYKGETSPLPEAVISSGHNSDTNVQNELPTTPQSASSTAETSFSIKFQSVVLKMMEHKKGLGSQTGAESSIPDTVRTIQLQTNQSIDEQTMTTSDNWAAFDSPVQGKTDPSYSPASTKQGMNNLNPLNLDFHWPVSNNWGISDPSNRQPSSTSGPAHVRNDMLHGVTNQFPTSSAASTNRKKELTNSEALFASTFSTFSWSLAPSSIEPGERNRLVLEEKQGSLEPLTSRNPFDVSNEPTSFQVSMKPSQEEYADPPYSARLLHSSSSLSNSSQPFSSTSSPYSMMPSAGLFHPGMASPCTYNMPLPHSPRSLRPAEHEGDENDGYWHSNSSFHSRLPARSKSFSFRGNPFA